MTRLRDELFWLGMIAVVLVSLAVMAVLDIGDWLLRPFRSRRRKHSTRTGTFIHRNLSS